MGATCSAPCTTDAAEPEDDSLRALRHAIEMNDAEDFRRLSVQQPSLLSVKDVADGRTALQAAVVHQRVDFVGFMLSQRLLSASALRSRDSAGNSALDLAAWQRATRVVHLLVQTGVAIEPSPGQRGWTPLHVSAFLDDAEVARVLCTALRVTQRRCPVSDSGDSPLHVAARRHASRAVAVILNSGCVPAGGCNGQGRTALHVACIHGALAVAQLLAPWLSNSLDALDAAGMAALHYASRDGHAPMCRALLANGAEIGAASGTGATPLVLAAEGGHVAVIRVLLLAIDDTSRRAHLGRRVGPEGQTALHAAAARDAAATIAALLEDIQDARGQVTEDGSAGKRPSVAVGPPRVVDAVDSEGRTALHVACAGNCAAAAQELLRLGAATSALDRSGATALEVARSSGAAACVALLIAAESQMAEVASSKHDEAAGGQTPPSTVEAGLSLGIGPALPRAETDAGGSDSTLSSSSSGAAALAAATAPVAAEPPSLPLRATECPSTSLTSDSTGDLQEATSSGSASKSGT